MNAPRSEVVRVSIQTPPRELISFLSDLNNWKTWAPWIRSVTRASARDWALETDAGPMKVHFVDPITQGLLDHEVTLASGLTVLNALRVSAIQSGSELMMVVVQQPGASTEEFQRDVQAVRDDLARLKNVAEARVKETAGS